MLMILAFLFALPVLTLTACLAVATLRAAPSLPALDSFQRRALSVARERLHAMTGVVDSLIEVRAMARLADERDERTACDALRAELAALRAPAPLSLVTRIKVTIGWLHGQSIVLRYLARPWRIARYHARLHGRVAVASTVLALALLGSACSVVKALPTRNEARAHTSAVIGGANAVARMVLR